MKIFAFISAVMLIIGCSERQADKAANATVKAEAAKDTSKYFQVVDYLKSQIAEVNRAPYFIYKLNVVGSVKDSTPIDNAQFNEISKQFLEPDINDPSLKKYYTESIFFDETTKSFNLNYSTTNKELEIQGVDILLAEDGKTIKRIFIRKFKDYNDSSAIEQLSWKPNERLQVNRLLQKKNSETSNQTEVVWNGNATLK